MSPRTVNTEQRTVDIVFFSGADVTRTNWLTGEEYLLRFDPKGADLSYLNNGAPLLNGHVFDTITDQLGRIDKAWSAGGQWLATIRISRHESLDRLWMDIQDGIVTKFSMGTEILKAENLPVEKGEMPVRLARKWRPYEISVVPVPADYGTTTLRALPPALRTENEIDPKAVEDEDSFPPNWGSVSYRIPWSRR